MDHTVQHAPADTLRPGQYIADPSIPGSVGEIAHVVPYHDADGRPRVAVTVMPLWHSAEPLLMRRHAADSVRLATPAEIDACQERRRRREVALGLVSLADQIEGGELPLGSYIGVSMSVGARADVDRWASALGVEVRVSDGWPTAHAYRGDLVIHVQGPREQETAAGDGVAPADAPGETATSPVAGAGAAPGTPTGGSGVPGVTPDEPAGGAR